MNDETVVKPKKSYLLIYAIIIFGGLFYVEFDAIQNYSTTPKWIFIVFASAAVLSFSKKEKLPWSKGISLWFIFVLLYIIQCFWSYNFWDSLVRTIPWIVAPMAVLLIRKEEDDLRSFYSKVVTVVACAIAPILLYSLYELLTLYSSDSFTHEATYELRYSFGNRNQYAQLITLLVPLMAIGIYYVKAKWQKILLYFVLVIMYLVASLLLNRTSQLALFGIYPIALILFLIRNTEAKVRKIAHRALLVGILLLSIVVLSPMRNSVPGLKNLTETSYGSGNERVRIWSNSMDLWRESPLIGHGSGDWKIEILRTPLEHTKAEQSLVFYQRAHNDFIQIAVENGILGLLVFLAFFIVTIVLIIKSNVDYSIKVFSIAGIIGYMLISNLSFPIERIELLMVLFLFSLPSIPLKSVSTKAYNNRKVITGVLISAIAFFSLTWFQNERAYFKFKKNDDKEAFAKINKSIYSIDPTATPLFWHEGNSHYFAGDYALALSFYTQAMKHNPNNVHVVNNIGSCYYGLGKIDPAEEYFKKALELNPVFVNALMNYTSLEFNRKNVNGALVLILKVPVEQEPDNYKHFILTITRAKYELMIKSYDEPKFEAFLNQTYNNDDFLYFISRQCRNSGASYERELRNYLERISSTEVPVAQ